MTIMFRKWLAVATAVLGACDVSSIEADATELADEMSDVAGKSTTFEVPTDAAPPKEEEPVVPMLVADFCDDATHAGDTWLSATSTHFTARYFAGTAAERDREEILAVREAAYQAIRTALGVTAEPSLSIYLSPSRLAAIANGRGVGTAWPAEGRLEVIYSGAEDSYERVRYGHELTHVLEAHLDPVNARRHPFMSEGLAEYLDQSGRDMHEAYAQQLIAGNESRVRVAMLESRDVSARNYGRAGSFVQFLVERYGMSKFLDVFRATAVTWSGGCWTHASAGCINTPEKLTAMIDGALTAKASESWATVQAAWEARVLQAIASADTAMPEADVKELQQLIAAVDRAHATGDVQMYRATLDGFYCDATADKVRMDVAQRAAPAFPETRTRVEAIYATGVKNFRTAQLVVRRTDARGLATFSSWFVEHFPAGWRVTYSPDWY